MEREASKAQSQERRERVQDTEKIRSLNAIHTSRTTTKLPQPEINPEPPKRGARVDYNTTHFHQATESQSIPGYNNTPKPTVVPFRGGMKHW